MESLYSTYRYTEHVQQIPLFLQVFLTVRDLYRILLICGGEGEDLSPSVCNVLHLVFLCV